MKLTWSDLSEFKGEITTRIFLGYIIDGITNGKLLPDPIPAIIVQSRPSKKASAESSCYRYGI